VGSGADALAPPLHPPTIWKRLAARPELSRPLRNGANVRLPSGFSILTGRTTTRKAPAFALLRAPRARELFPEPLADAHWE
jgi:hypothetical protein